MNNEIGEYDACTINGWAHMPQTYSNTVSLCQPDYVISIRSGPRDREGHAYSGYTLPITIMNRSLQEAGARQTN